MLKISMYPVIDWSELEKEVRKESHQNVCVLSALWPYGVPNDSTQCVWFRDEKDSSKPRVEEGEDEANLFYDYLSRNIPMEYSSVMIDICW